ncbi:D-aminoacyl-tRNA deacylase [uncultured archaeon]|nr:D-aminoacyl-tRNA deacylase [uncultured archaeon]
MKLRHAAGAGGAHGLVAMKPLVVISKENAASQNIKSALLKLGKFGQAQEGFWPGADFDMAEYSGSIIEIVPDRQAEYYIYASTHKSESGKPSFTVHTQGNWGNADFGGRPRTLNIACPAKLKVALRKLKELSDASLTWEACMEVDHHGPTLDAPVFFIEIGSTEKEWGVPAAGGIVARAIIAAVESKEEFPCYVGFGGTHYTSKFTPIVLGSEKAIGHIISGYSLEGSGLDEGRVRQALEKNVGKIEAVLLDWKGIKGGARKELIAMLEKLGVKWEKA